MKLPELTYDELKAINALPDDAARAAIILLDSLYASGDLSIDQHAGITRGFLSLRAQLDAAQERAERAERLLIAWIEADGTMAFADADEDLAEYARALQASASRPDHSAPA